jgi:hypothetical protein
MVNYDLKGPVGGYNQFFLVLQNEGPWWHFMTSTWLINTQSTPKQLAEKLTPLIQQGDWLLVSHLSTEYWGWLPKDAWDWIAAQGKG